ncbi:DUF2975 domain-containing protein [Clostridioides sp. ES-S-0145-01]|uniref:DUF2975 domain-containing protein n=2 Tax=unclassified Clostridioides TaxID=2635829 RepID=UPI001D11CB5E|nr:DUF2975 domain-containing protein [Clostridioides sp. ES-S-0145-01]
MSDKFIKNLLNGILQILFFLLALVLSVGGIKGFSYICFSGEATIQSFISGILRFSLVVSYFIIVKSLLEILNSSEYSLFINENVKRFRLIGYLLLLNSVIEFSSTFGTTGTGMRFLDLGFGFYFTVPTLVYFVVALMSFVISDGFKKAIKIKEDNDLII